MVNARAADEDVKRPEDFRCSATVGAEPSSAGRAGMYGLGDSAFPPIGIRDIRLRVGEPFL